MTHTHPDGISPPRTLGGNSQASYRSNRLAVRKTLYGSFTPCHGSGRRSGGLPEVCLNFSSTLRISTEIIFGNYGAFGEYGDYAVKN